MFGRFSIILFSGICNLIPREDRLVVGALIWCINPEGGFQLWVAFSLYLDCHGGCLLYTSPSPRDRQKSRMPSSA